MHPVMTQKARDDADGCFIGEILIEILIVSLDESRGYLRFSTACCIPGRKSGILRIQYGHAAAAEISFWTR